MKPSAIAIIGVAGRFPGARSVAEFWRNLCEGVESVTFFSEEELKSVGIDPKRPSERTGVSLMNAFARQLRGQSCIASGPNGGARVELSFPLTEPADVE